MVGSKLIRQFDAPTEQLLDALEDAFHDIGASGVRWVDDYTVRASMGFSFWSYGEDMTAEVLDDGEIEVESNCSFPFQLIDWGKNGRNCRRLLDAVEDRLERPRRRRK